MFWCSGTGICTNTKIRDDIFTLDLFPYNMSDQSAQTVPFSPRDPPWALEGLWGSPLKDQHGVGLSVNDAPFFASPSWWSVALFSWLDKLNTSVDAQSHANYAQHSAFPV